MADDRAALLEKLAKLDQAELSAEQKRILERLWLIRAEAAKRAAAEEADSGPLIEALNLAEEAAQLGARLGDIQTDLLRNAQE